MASEAPTQSYRLRTPLPANCDRCNGLLFETRTKLWIIVGVDYFTRWCEIKVTEKNDSAAMTDFLVNQWFLRFGAPEELVTDLGTPLVSIDFRSICAALGLTKIQTTAGHPQSNACVERVNRSIKTMLHALAYSNNRW